MAYLASRAIPVVLSLYIGDEVNMLLIKAYRFFCLTLLINKGPAVKKQLIWLAGGLSSS